MAGLFQKLEFEAFRKGITPRSKESRAWFSKKASQLGVSRSGIFKEDEILLRSRPAVGKMYMYFYDPKYKETLPYYDRFPLTSLKVFCNEYSARRVLVDSVDQPRTKRQSVIALVLMVALALLDHLKQCTR